MKRAPPATADWTILVYLNAKNNLEPFSFLNFEQMAKVGSSKRVNILVEFGRPNRHYPMLPGFEDIEDWSKTLRFRVGKGMKPTEARALMDLGKTNMGSRQALADFVSWGLDAFPARHTALVIWDHGQGWRAPTATRLPPIPGEPPRRRSPRVDATTGLPTDARVHGGFRYVSMDEDTGDKLFNREIQDGLAEALDGRKLDLIAFDACLMGMLETAYALRHAAVAMAASEELEPGDGWDYQRWLAPLVAHPEDFDGPGLAKHVVKAYEDRYGDSDNATMAAIDLGQIEAAAGAVDAVCDLVLGDLDAALPALRHARKNCAVFAPRYGFSSIDLQRLLSRLSLESSGASPALRSAAASARLAVKAAVLANHSARSRYAPFGARGLGIYFPESGSAFRMDPDRTGYLRSNTSFPVEFVQTRRWAELIEQWVALVP